jgi:hypothetical protein
MAKSLEEFVDYYAVLGIDSDASKEDIKSAYEKIITQDLTPQIKLSVEEGRRILLDPVESILYFMKYTRNTYGTAMSRIADEIHKTCNNATKSLRKE